MRQKGFIITIQSNSTRTEVASTWRRRKHTTVQRVACYWREPNSGTEGITLVCPMAQFQLQDSFMFWMVREKTFFLLPLLNQMTFNAIFSSSGFKGEHPAAKYTSAATSCFSHSVIPCTTLLLLFHHCRTSAILARLSWLLWICARRAVKWNWCSDEASTLASLTHPCSTFIFFLFFFVL